MLLYDVWEGTTSVIYVSFIVSQYEMSKQSCLRVCIVLGDDDEFLSLLFIT